MRRCVEGLNKRVIVWDEAIQAFPEKLPRDVLVQGWRNPDLVLQGANRGHEVIMSWREHLYLDWMKTDWKQVYNWRVCMMLFSLATRARCSHLLVLVC